MTIKILQVGAGLRGRHWIQFARAHPDFEVVGIVEPDTGSREKAKAVAGDSRFFTDLGEALRPGQGRRRDRRDPFLDPRRRLHPVPGCRARGPGREAARHDGCRLAPRPGARAGRPGVPWWLPRITATSLPSARSSGSSRKDFLGRVHHALLIDRRNQPSRVEGPWLGKMEYPQLQEIASHHFDSLRALFGSRPKNISLRVWNPAWSDYAHGACTEAHIDFGDVQVQYMGNQLSHRYGFTLWIDGEKGVLWTNRRIVAWRPARQPLVPPHPQ